MWFCLSASGRGDFQLVARTKDRKPGGRIPPGEICVDRIRIVDPHAQAILASERASDGDDCVFAVNHPAGGSPCAEHLNNRGSVLRRESGEII
jgi:hypothetical protein